MTPAIASLYQAVDIRQDIPPLIIGERCNANGSKVFREHLLAEDWDACLAMALEQEAAGAHVVDLCTAYAGRDERRDLCTLVPLFARTLRTPLMIDSTTPACIEACLRLYPGRALVNSINLEDGGANLRTVCRLVKRYGAAVVALTIHDKGMAMTAEDKVATAHRIHDIAVGEFGLRPGDLLFDALTFTIGAGDATLRDAAAQTLTAIRRIKAELPGVFTMLGVSNVSFGLPPHGRRVLNSVFLHEAIEAGLDAAIIDAAKVLPLNRIPESERELCLDLIYDRTTVAERPPLTAFIEHFHTAAGASGAGDQQAEEEARPEAALTAAVVNGRKEGVEELLLMLLQRLPPVAIINQVLVPAMRHVGELFGRGEMLLPFVLQSAEVMKQAVSFLEPRLQRGEAGRNTCVLLATVQGDVHDIGKNLVDIILSNNGCKVVNLGIKVPAPEIIAKAREHQADIIGLSGLLVKSAIVMQESMPLYRASGLRTPILLGGAALTRKFVAQACVPGHDGPVVYCADAFAGLKAVQEFEAGRLHSTSWEAADEKPALKPGVKTAAIDRSNRVPRPPFLGARHRSDIPVAAVLPYMNRQALFRGRWGYRRAKLNAAEYEELIATKVVPMYEALCERACAGELFEPAVAYGWFPCHGAGDRVVVDNDGNSVAFAFPRQQEPPYLCIADYFKTREDGGDIAGFFVASAGARAAEATATLYAANRYHDYLVLHGFGVEFTDALAEYWHEVMRRELGVDGTRPDSVAGYVTQEYQGSRYGFGYPACPDLDAHRPLFDLLEPERLGITLTENMQMVPEMSTSAIVAHHPQAKYFAV